LAGNDNKEIQSVKNFLDNLFIIKSLGSLRYFLGLEISISDTGIILNQRKYTLDLLEETGCLAAKPADTHQSLKLHNSGFPLFEDETQFRKAILSYHN
jgi:hypothetical protein